MKRIRIAQYRGNISGFYYKIEKKNIFGKWKTLQTEECISNDETSEYKADIVFNSLEEAKQYIIKPQTIVVVYRTQL